MCVVGLLNGRRTKSFPASSDQQVQASCLRGCDACLNVSLRLHCCLLLIRHEGLAVRLNTHECLCLLGLSYVFLGLQHTCRMPGGIPPAPRLLTEQMEPAALTATCKAAELQNSSSAVRSTARVLPTCTRSGTLDTNSQINHVGNHAHCPQSLSTSVSLCQRFLWKSSDQCSPPLPCKPA